MSDSADDCTAIVGSVAGTSAAGAEAGAVSAEASSGVRNTEQVSADTRVRGLVLNWAGISGSSGRFGDRTRFSRCRRGVSETSENVNVNAYDSRLRSQFYGLVSNL
ncbi:hypothetical protein M3665_25015, partial [Bacillus licheniformis]|nr:hypothetical protein [Bacillus licheniformis]